MTTQGVTFDLLFVSLVVLLLVLMVLLILCWVLRRSRSKKLTELRLSAGQPAHVLTIKTKPDHAHQLLDQLLDRVFPQVEPAPESRGEPGAEPGMELGGEQGSDSGSDVGISTAETSFPRRAIPPPRPPRPLANQDQAGDLSPQQLDVSQHASLSSQGTSCSACWEEEEQHNDKK